MDKILILAKEVGKLKKQIQTLLDTPPAIHNFVGEQGVQGVKGLDGKDGISGKDGRDGKDGKDGKNGIQGISVVSAEVTFDNHLVLTLSDGNEIDAGQIAVQAGETVQIVQNKTGDPLMFSTRYDQVSSVLAYKGEAFVGASDAQASWRIQKLVYGTDGDVTITWANGNTDFSNTWNDRATLTYQ